MGERAKPSFLAANRKAIFAAATAFFGALGTALLKDGISAAECAGIVGATVLAGLGVYAAPANEKPAEPDTV